MNKIQDQLMLNTFKKEHQPTELILFIIKQVSAAQKFVSSNKEEDYRFEIVGENDGYVVFINFNDIIPIFSLCKIDSTEVHDSLNMRDTLDILDSLIEPSDIYEVLLNRAETIVSDGIKLGESAKEEYEQVEEYESHDELILAEEEQRKADLHKGEVKGIYTTINQLGITPPNIKKLQKYVD